MKNQKMSTKITLVIWVVITICISLLYMIANKNMTTLMKQSEMENLHDSLDVQMKFIEEYVTHQEHMLIVYSKEPVVIEFLKEPDNDQKRKAAQAYTEKYYADLDNWEGLYIGEWNTHVIAHSNPEVVGMITREGESLKELQNEMLSRNGLYNASIIISPASGQLVLSLYCPVFDYDGKTILGYVGGGPFAEELRELLASVEKESTQYYMVNVESGMYIFAEDESLMATEIKDEMLLSVIASILKDETIINGDIEYTDAEDEKSIAAYYYIPENGWALVSCNSEEHIYADVNRNMRILGIICIVSDLVIGALAWILIRVSIKPLKYVETSIIQLKELKLEKRHELDKYINCKSEIGQIATALDSLYDSIKEMLKAESEKQIAMAASESKAKFLASMSHEIRTPINTVVGMSEMILRENKDETIREYAYNIKSASQMLLGLINDVLDFSKIEAGKLQLSENDYRLPRLLKDVVLGIKERAEQKNLELKMEFDETMPAVLKGDEIRIKQILNNLLSNAVKYTEKGHIIFSARGIYREKEFVLVMSVTDTGIGIRKEDMDRLFDSFQRLELKKNRYIEGAGLGLNITKQLVDIMNGSIEVESEHGKGSCFTVQIPQQIVDKTPMGPLNSGYEYPMQDEEASREILYAPDAKVLIVDDNRMNLRVMKELLKRSQIQLDFAMGGNECLQMTKEKKYDLILMDHMMPEPDGVQTLHLLREQTDNSNNQTPVIVLTANAIAGIEEQYRKEGFADYLSKPVKVDKLEETLACYLGGKTLKS